MSDPRPQDEREDLAPRPGGEPAAASPEEAAAAAPGSEAAARGEPDDAGPPPAGARAAELDGAAPPQPVDPVDVESLVADLERVTSERDQFLDAYRRAQADYENFRKQSQRRQEEAANRALGSFVERLLPVLDACDAAISHGATGVEPVLTALYQALEKEGLERVAPEGETFDPEVSEAVVHEPDDGGEPVVAEVLRTGYTWNGRVLRPAMVRVTGG